MKLRSFYPEACRKKFGENTGGTGGLGKEEKKKTKKPSTRKKKLFKFNDVLCKRL